MITGIADTGKGGAEKEPIYRFLLKKMPVSIAIATSEGAFLECNESMLQMTGYRYLVWLLPLRPNFMTRLAESLQKIVYRSSWRNQVFSEKPGFF